MNHDIDFSQLSLRDVLDLAISIEEEAKERYDDFAAQMDAHKTNEAAKFFRFMAENEIKHAERIAEQRKSLFDNQPSTADRSLLFDIEAPEYDAVRAFMSVQSALEVALKSEIKAYDFYDGALGEVTDADVKELFVQLRDEESRHQAMIREVMERIPDGGTFDPDDFVDEPVGH